jgi:hypothetical protein
MCLAAEHRLTTSAAPRAAMLFWLRFGHYIA